jgi:hypothetical protein
MRCLGTAMVCSTPVLVDGVENEDLGEMLGALVRTPESSRSM